MGFQKRVEKLENRISFKRIVDKKCSCAAVCRFHSVNDVKRLTNEICPIHGLRYYNCFFYAAPWVVELARKSGDPTQRELAALDISLDDRDFATTSKIKDQLFADYESRVASHPMREFFRAKIRALAERRSGTKL